MYVKSIYFERTGGFSGIRLETHIELDDLPDDQKHEILDLIEELDIDVNPEGFTENDSRADEITYSLRVISDEKEYRVTASESNLPDDMETLIKIMERFAKKRARGNQ